MFRVSQNVAAACILLAVTVTSSSAFRLPESISDHHRGNLTSTRVLNGSIILTHPTGIQTSARIENGTISMFVKPGNATAVVQNGTVTFLPAGGRPLIANILNGTLNLVLLKSGASTKIARIQNGTFALELYPGNVIIGSVLNGTVNYGNGTNWNGFNGTVTLAPPNGSVTPGNFTYNLPTVGPILGNETVGPLFNGTATNAPPLQAATQGSGFSNVTATQTSPLNPVTRGTGLGNGTVGPIVVATKAPAFNPVTQGSPIGDETKGPKKHHSHVTTSPVMAKFY